MKAKSEETKKKLRGGYYTPEPIARYLAEWAIEDGAKSILEPSSGDGRIVEALARANARREEHASLRVEAVELLDEEADKTREKAYGLDAHVSVATEDFFEWITNGKRHEQWDAVVGNPPYIRYQYFNKEQRARASHLVERAGLKFSKRTNAWMPFVVAAVQHLRPGGRLAMVVPSEILHIQHAQGLRLFLEREMKNLTLISFREIVFDGTLQGTLLLMGERRETLSPDRSDDQKNMFANRTDGETSAGSDKPSSTSRSHRDSTRFSFIDVGGIEDLPLPKVLSAHRADGHARAFEGEWMKAFLKPEELALVDRLLERDDVHQFDQLADVKIGIVTGANRYFVVDAETVDKYELGEITAPLLARSSHAQGLVYDEAEHEENVQRGRSVTFLHFPDQPIEELPEKMQQYIREGEEKELHERYKCRIREPWYRVPYVWASELAMPKRSHRYPRIVYNEARTLSTDTLYRIRPHEEFEGRGREIAFSFLNSLTLLLAEIHGRHYGGGVLELVPSEINRLHMPLIDVETSAFDEADQMIRGNAADADELMAFTNRIVLKQGMGLASSEVAMLRSVHERYVKRRLREK